MGYSTIFILAFIVIGLLFWMIVHKFNSTIDKKRKNRAKEVRKELLTHRNTVISDYLWVIRILKKYDYTIKSKSGIDTNHLVLVFENPQGQTIQLEHNYKDKDDEQGRCFLKTDTENKEITLYLIEDQIPEIELWVTKLKQNII